MASCELDGKKPQAFSNAVDELNRLFDPSTSFVTAQPRSLIVGLTPSCCTGGLQRPTDRPGILARVLPARHRSVRHHSHEGTQLVAPKCHGRDTRLSDADTALSAADTGLSGADTGLSGAETCPSDCFTAPGLGSTRA
eukprot:6152631-Pleurochrysis_carterae.AAC.1